MDFRTIKNRIRKCTEWFKQPYEPINEKPLIQIAELALVLPALGIYYVWEYFNKYGIDYYMYFDLKDGLAILYQNLMPIIYIGTMLSLTLPIFIPNIIKKRTNGIERTNGTEQVSGSPQQNGIPNYVIAGIVMIGLIGFGVLLNVYQFSFSEIVFFILLAVGASALYLFRHKKAGFGAIVVLAVIYTTSIANKNAKYNQRTKPRINIVLKSHSETPILTEDAKDKYLIYKSSNYYFIKDEEKKMILIYATSTGEMASFKAK